jgi:hypothetical protein
LKIEPSDKQDIYPFQDISLTRDDLEWLIQRPKEKSVSDVEQQQGLNLREAILGDIDCTLLPLKGADFRGAKLEGTKFVKADAIASRSKTGHPDKKRLKNTSSGTPTSERQLTVRRWMCEPVGWRGPHDHPVALSYDNCAH